MSCVNNGADCPNLVETYEMGRLEDDPRNFTCGCDARPQEGPVERALREGYEHYIYSHPITEPVDVTSIAYSAKKLAYVVPVPSDLLADQGVGVHDGGTPRKKKRPTMRERWYNLRVSVGSWILPFDPYED